jgi:hypothetical protein
MPSLPSQAPPSKAVPSKTTDVNLVDADGRSIRLGPADWPAWSDNWFYGCDPDIDADAGLEQIPSPLPETFKSPEEWASAEAEESADTGEWPAPVEPAEEE